MNKTVCICTLLLWINVLSGFSQTNTKKIESVITGSVLNDKERPAELANVAILTPQDSIFVKGTCSRNDGSFEINSLPEGKYLIQVSYLGYQTLCQPCTTGENIVLHLQPETQTLQETVITARRPRYRLKNNVLTASVQNTLLATVGTANDVLKHLPAVQVSNEELYVFGKGTPAIYIDNRLIRDIAELERINSSDIEMVELITNPGAEYDATVKAVIRIKTVHNRQEGMGADVRAILAQGIYTNHNEQLNLSYRKRAFSIWSSLHYTLSKNKRNQDVQYEIASASNRIINSATNLINLKKQTGAKLSTSYDFNPDHSAGIAYEYSRTPNRRIDGTSDYTVKTDGILVDRVDYVSQNIRQETVHQLNAYYQGKIKNLRIDFTTDILKGHDSDQQNSEEASRTEEHRNIDSYSKANKWLYAGKLILSHPLWKGELKCGTDFTFIRREDRFDNPQQLLPATDSKINESKTAGFLSYSLTWGKVNSRAGIRFEHTVSDYREKGIFIPEQSRVYNDWCPDISIDFPIGKAQVSLSYTVKTNRPSFYQLRSSISYNNRYVYEGGNPFLIPETDHDLALFVLYHWLQFSVNYQYQKNAIQFDATAYTPNPDIAIFTFANFPKLQYLNAGLYLTPTIKRWKPEFGLFFTQPFFEIESEGKNKKLNTPGAYFSWKNSFELPAGIILSLDMNYQTKSNYGAAYLRPNGQIDAGVRKSFLNKTLDIHLRASDILATSRSSPVLYSPKLIYSRQANPYTRQISLTIRYNFNPNRTLYKGKHVSVKDMQRL